MNQVSHLLVLDNRFVRSFWVGTIFLDIALPLHIFSFISEVSMILVCTFENCEVFSWLSENFFGGVCINFDFVTKGLSSTLDLNGFY